MPSILKDAIVVIANNSDGHIDKIIYDVLNPAITLSIETSKKVILITENDIDDGEYEELKKIPIDKILIVDTYKQMIAFFIKYRPYIILVGATIHGRIEGAKIAYSIKRELVSDVVKIYIDKDSKKIIAEKPSVDGKYIDCCKINADSCVITIRKNVFPPCCKNEKSEVIKVERLRNKTIKDYNSRVIIPKQNISHNIQEASFIVAGGRGLKGIDGFKLLKELADIFNGMVGCSRPCVDMGILNASHQIGQSGVTVKPKIYIAFGISGAIQHRVGVKADIIIVVNNDLNSEFFKYCNFGIVGDANDILNETINILLEKETLV